MNKRQKVASSTRSTKAKQKAQYRVRNWAKYNQSLVQRGSLTFWIGEDVLDAWKPKLVGQRPRGAPQEYTDTAIECMLVLRAVFHLTLREAEGFVRSLFELAEIKVEVPDYTTLCKRAKGLWVKLPTTSQGPIHAGLDSSGLKLYGEGEWKVRQHGYSKRRTWRKLHLSVDSTAGEIQAVVLTEAGVDDAEAAKSLLNQTQAPIEKLSADGAYDKRKVYQACQQHEVSQINIPPRRDAHIWQPGNSSKPPLVRDQNLRRIRQVGRKRWKQETGYHQRSLGENMVFRFKTIFGDHLASRQIPQQITEARIKCLALNRMTQLGMPESYRVA